MIFEQTIEIPTNRRVIFDFPISAPVGKAKVELRVTPALGSQVSKSAKKENALAALAILRGMYKDEAKQAGGFLDRKHAEKELEYQLEEGK
jgi:hypothetical protein